MRANILIFEDAEGKTYYNCCPRCMPKLDLSTMLVGTEDNPDFAFCQVHGKIPINEVLNYSKPKKYVTHKEFSAIIKRASQPLKSSFQKEGGRSAEGYSGKKTRQHKIVSTSEKRHDKSH
jgi:hypothetical protein